MRVVSVFDPMLKKRNCGSVGLGAIATMVRGR
jgi:hypothetical protein